MKRFLSIMLAAAMLMSVFCFNVSAAVPTKTGGEWSVLISEDFEADTPTYFTKKDGSLNGVTYVAETGNAENMVVDLKLGGTYAGEEGDANNGKYYNNVRIGQGTDQKDALTSDKDLTGTYMIEFDLCAINPVMPFIVGVRSAARASNAVRINPNNLTVGEWYTFRILVESTETLDIDATTTTVYKKLRGSNEGFVEVPGVAMTNYNTAMTKDTTANYYHYGMRGFYSSSLVTFGFSNLGSYAYPYIDSMDATTNTDAHVVTGTTASTANHYAAGLATNYQVDNITIYSKSAETTPELSNGIIKYWDMEDESEIVTNCDSIKVEDTTGDGTLDSATYAVNSVMLEDSTEDNHYVKFAPGVAPFASTTDYMVSWVKGDSTFTLPETFILSFDANNAALGTGIDFVIRGDGEVKAKESGSGTDPYFPRGTLYLRSHSGILNKWYSYKVVCKGTPYAIGAYTFTVYRRERGSDGAWTELSGASFAGKDISETGTMDYGWASTMSGAEQWINSIQIGSDRRGLLDAYTTVDANSINNPADATEDQTNHENGVWYIDNVMITEAAAITGDVSVADSKVTAALNLSTVAASTPILAVYDGTKLVDVDFAPVAHEGAATLTAKYDTTALTTPKAMLYVWDSLANGKPVLAEAIDVATYIAE